MKVHLIIVPLHSRFIRARKHDLAAAKEMWTKYMEWRKDFGTDTIEKVRSSCFAQVDRSLFWWMIEGEVI